MRLAAEVAFRLDEYDPYLDITGKDSVSMGYNPDQPYDQTTLSKFVDVSKTSANLGKRKKKK